MTVSDHNLSEEAIRALEAEIPGLVTIATKMAYQKAKRSGQTVVLSKGGFIVAEHPDGTERILATCKPMRKVPAGVLFKIGQSLE